MSSPAPSIEDQIRALAPQVDAHPVEVAKACIAAVTQQPFLVPAYKLLAKALHKLQNAAGLDQAGAMARDNGLALVRNGRLAEAASFFEEVASAFPAVCAPYGALFRHLDKLMAGDRSILVPPNPAASRRRALIALALWGDPVVDLFVRYCLPSLLSPGNLPALSRMREVHVVAYTAAAHAEALRQAAPFQRLADLVHAQISRFPQEILAPPGSADLRSWISGGLHHVAIEQARGLDADLMILAPDCVYSDGSLANCARFIDEGYRAVVAPAVRAQAEGVCPLYDGWRDEAAHTLTVSARRLAEVATQNLHLGYARNLAVRDNQSMPFGPSFLVFPHARGVYIRSLRLYPHMIAADVLKTPIVFDYAAIDGHAMAGFFPNPEDWARVKVLENSDDGLWLEMGYAGAPDVSPGSTFRLDLLTADGYLPHQIRAFQHRLDVHGDSTMDAVGAFERLPTGAVERRAVPVASRIELDDQAVAAWFAANLPKPPRPA